MHCYLWSSNFRNDRGRKYNEKYKKNNEDEILYKYKIDPIIVIDHICAN